MLAAPLAVASPVATLQRREGQPLAMAHQLARGRLVVHRFTLAGRPLRGAFEVVRYGARGDVRTVASRGVELAPELAPTDARLGGEAAWQRFVANAPAGGPAAPERAPELVYRLVGGVPIMAWEVQLPLVIRPEPTRRTIWLSAESGELIDERENVFTSRARIYPENPSRTPVAIDVTLHDIDVDGPGVPLVGTRISAMNCSAVAPAVVPPWHDEGDCFPVARTHSDVGGDFYVALPNILHPTESMDPDDLYAELSMYAHGERFLQLMAARGLEGYRCEHSLLLGNFRGLTPSVDRDFEPLNNAFFSDQCDPEQGATMVFGQGTDVDFAFDGDVIYHELGHGVVAMLAPEGLTQANRRSDGLLVDATAINEAVADYISVMVTGDPELAEYVGRFAPAQSTPYIRTAENDRACPNDLAGQSHNDSEPLMGALWVARTAIGKSLDDVVLQSLTRLAPDATLEDMAARLVEVAGEMQDAGQLTEADVEILARELDARSLFDCPRVVTDAAEVARGRTLYLRKVNAAVTPWWPGPMQLRYEIPEGAQEAVVEAELTARGDGDASAIVLVKRSDRAIEFSYDVVRRDDAGDPSGAATKAREVTLVGGDWDLAVPAERVGGATHRARIGGLRAGEIIHVAFAGTAEVDVVASSLRILDPAAGAGGDETGENGETSEDASLREAVHGGNAQASCACDTGARPRLWALSLAVLLLRRRRR